MRKLIKIFSLLLLLLAIFSCEQSVYTGPPDEPAIKNRKIFIQSKPSHATIYLDGKNLGIQTPDTIKLLPTNNNVVTLKLPMYSDTTFVVDVVAGQTNNVFIDFTRNTKNVGKIDCSSDPNGANIWLNDSMTNKKTPFTLEHIAPGNYKVKLTSSLHRPDSSIVTVFSNTTTNVFLTLEDTSKWVSYNKRNSKVISNYISALACDKQNKIWIGTDKGLMKFDGKILEIYTTQNSPLPQDIITSVAVDQQNRKWIGTGNGLIIFDNGIWTNYTANLPGSYITCIAVDHRGNAWVGTQNGLVKYSNGVWQTFTTVNSGLKDNMVSCLAIDNSNRVWVGSLSYGISVFDGNSWGQFNSSNINLKNQSLNYIQAIAADNQGGMWVSAYDTTTTDPKTGLPKLEQTNIFTYDGNKWFGYRNQALLFNLTYSLFAKNQYVILCNKNGLDILNNDTGIFFSFDQANSALQLFRIQTATIDDLNNVWIGTFMNGIGKFKRGNF